MTSDEGRKPEGAPERSAKAGVGAPSGVDGNGPKRFSVQRKIAIVARLLRGEPLDLVARQTNVSIARLTEWRDRALAGAATALKERERDDRDDEIAWSDRFPLIVAWWTERPYAAMAMGWRRSRGCADVKMTTPCSSTPSTSWSSTAPICGGPRSKIASERLSASCARPSPGCG